jgi:hypothetical protein
LLLHERSVEQIVAELTTVELEQVIKLVGRSPRVYPPGTLDALKQWRTSISPQLPGDSGASDLATKEPAGRDTRLSPGLGAGGHSPQSTQRQRFTSELTAKLERDGDPDVVAKARQLLADMEQTLARLQAEICRGAGTPGAGHGR